jgi:AbrB family looped-hinge helix DNA binding protein
MPYRLDHLNPPGLLQPQAAAHRRSATSPHVKWNTPRLRNLTRNCQTLHNSSVYESSRPPLHAERPTVGYPQPHPGVKPIPAGRLDPAVVLDSTPVAQLAVDNAIGKSTVDDYLAEGFTVLAARAPKLESALLAATMAGHSHISIDVEKSACVKYASAVTHSSSEAPSGEVTVNEQGRVTIPAQVRRAAGIETGVPLVVYVEDGRIVIETREQLADRIRRDVAAAWVGEGSVVDELIADRRAEAAREDSP